MDYSGTHPATGLLHCRPLCSCQLRNLHLHQQNVHLNVPDVRRRGHNSITRISSARKSPVREFPPGYA
jgi:hypothetical protein